MSGTWTSTAGSSMPLGKYLDGREGLEFVDIGGIGEWGEMHLGLHIDGRWTSQQLEATGFTRDKYVAAYRRVIDAHAQAFPNTRVFLNVGAYPEINDYAAWRGCHFRQDGLTPSGPSATLANCTFAHIHSAAWSATTSFIAAIAAWSRKAGIFARPWRRA